VAALRHVLISPSKQRFPLPPAFSYLSPSVSSPNCIGFGIMTRSARFSFSVIGFPSFPRLDRPRPPCHLLSPHFISLSTCLLPSYFLSSFSLFYSSLLWFLLFLRRYQFFSLSFLFSLVEGVKSLCCFSPPLLAELLPLLFLQFPKRAGEAILSPNCYFPFGLFVLFPGPLRSLLLFFSFFLFKAFSLFSVTTASPRDTAAYPGQPYLPHLTL